MTKLEVFRKIYDLHDEGEKYYNEVPSDLACGLFDNRYSTNRDMTVDVLMRAYFTPSENEDVCWFLYEWYNNKSLTITIASEEFSFDTVDEYIVYLTRRGWE